MESHVAHRNVLLYKLFVLFSESLFWGPILIISLQRLGKLSLPEIYFMESAVMIICIVLNVPCGALADMIGRKKTLIIGRFFLLVSVIGFALMDGPLLAWTANAIWAIGYSLQSGADQALLYNTLKRAGLEKQYLKIEGCATGSRLIIMAFCALAVGPLAEIDLRLPLYLSIPGVAIPLVVSFFFKENRTLAKYDMREQITTLKRGVMFAIRKPEVRWIIGLCALLMGASKIWFFTYNPYFEKVGISLRYYGIIFFILNIIAWFFSHYAHDIKEYFSEKVCVRLMILCVGVPILLMGLFPIWPMALLVIVQNVVRGFMGPFVGNFMNHHIESEDIRATALSVRSSITDCIAVVSLSSFGLLDHQLGLLHSLIVLGVIVLVLGKISYARYNRLFPESVVITA